ncbi:MAG: hypothetical protein LUG12_00155 [Erysipelotrichaceae bacterium]|nr:hypothetical protein [Erysipelotrichaceae bacterium]
MDNNVKNVWIHCRVIDRDSMELLNFQEHVLCELSYRCNFNIIGISKIVSIDNNNNRYQINAMNHAIRAQKVDAVLVYTRERISTDKNILDEFMMFCDMCHVKFVTYHQLKDALNL